MSRHNSDSFEHYLRQWRKRRRLTQDVLAERAGTYPSVISHFESGGRAISLDMAVRLCRALDIKLGQLLEPPPDVEAPSLDERVKDLPKEHVAEIDRMVESIVRLTRG